MAVLRTRRHLTTGPACIIGLLATQIFCVALPGNASADPIDYGTARFDRRLAAKVATGRIVIDGQLDEPDWTLAPVATDFIQSEPREGEPASEDTVVRVLYDKANLYVGFSGQDANPAGIIVNELKKDFSSRSADVFVVTLDTFHDRRNSYIFGVNAGGARWDGQSANEGRELNANWDGLWYVRTSISETGWTAEMAIPFRTLRFRDADPQTWGINFLRRIRRRNEDSYWSPIPRFYNVMRVSLSGTLEGLTGVRPGSDLRIKPYVLGSGGESTRATVDGEFDGGVDVKYGVTSGLTWDFTVNTDFSQVEADEQQVNLTRFSLFFPEKRDFFLENSGVFQFGQGANQGSGGAAGRQNAVRRDLVLFFSRRIGLSATGDAVPILGGTRLTGRAGPYTIGALNIQQRRSGESPAANFAALRLRRNILQNSDIGVMLLNKESAGNHYNRVLGTDANFRFFGDLRFNASVAKTLSPMSVVGSQGRDTSVQLASRYRDPFWDVRVQYLTIGERFNDELGFVPRVGINKVDGFIGTHIRPKRTSGWLREIFPHWQYDSVTRIGRGLESRYLDYQLGFTLQDGTSFEVGLNSTTEALFSPFTINRRRDVVIELGQFDFTERFVVVRTNQSAPVSVNGRYAVGEFYDGDQRSSQIGGTLRWNERVNTSFSVSRNSIRLSGGDFTTNLLTSRVAYSFSTRMFFNALLQYNTDAREWSSNVRFNIIHRPLSDFFLVYNERRDTHGNDLLDRAVITKMTYLLAF